MNTSNNDKDWRINLRVKGKYLSRLRSNGDITRADLKGTIIKAEGELLTILLDDGVILENENQDEWVTA